MSRGCRLNRGDHAKVTTSLTPGEDRGSHSHPASGVCRKNEFLCANSVTLCVSVVKLPGKTFTTEARSLHREPRRTFSDRLLQPGGLRITRRRNRSMLTIGGAAIPHD